MQLKKYLLEVVEGKEEGLRAQIILKVLLFLSWIYKGIVLLRRILYDLNLKKGTKLDATVISVGNITVGGTGKTPVVKTLARELINRGHKVVILSRGYKGEYSEGIGVVCDGENMLMSAEEAGDEAYMLAQNLSQVPVIVGAKREKTGKYACQEFNPDFIILDDGFQHRQVARNYEIVTVDAVNPFGNGYLLPRGRLREPVDSLKRAHCFLLTKTDQISAAKLEELIAKLKNIDPQAEIITTRHAPAYLRKIGTKDRKEIKLAEEDVLAVSGIGSPESFEETLKKLGAEVVEKIRFQDHHAYTDEEVVDIFTLASEKQVDKIVTTEKDAVSMNKKMVEEINRQQIELEVLGIEIKTVGEDKEVDRLVSKLEVLAKCR